MGVSLFSSLRRDGDARVGFEMIFPLATLTCFAAGQEDALARGEVEVLEPGATRAVDLSLPFSLAPNLGV